MLLDLASGRRRGASEASARRHAQPFAVARRTLRALEWLGLVGIILAYTKGPIFSMRLEVEPPLAGDFIDDTRVQLAFLVAAVVPVLGGLASVRLLRRDRWFVVAWLALPALVVLSTAWSVDRERTFEQGVMMMAGCLAAVAIGLRWSTRALVWGLFTATHAGLLCSLWAERRGWPRVFDLNGKLAGIYFNRNSFGAVAVTALFASVWVSVDAPRLVARAVGGPRSRVVGFAGLGAGSVVALFDLWLWRRSGSDTPIVAAAVALAGAGPLVRVFRRASARWPDRETRIGAAAAVGVGTAVVGALLARGLLAGGHVKATTLSGRTLIWQVVWDFVYQRPLAGWGYMGPWRLRPIADALWYKGLYVYEAHSGYLEVLLGLGLVGGLVLAFVFVRSARACVVAATSGRGWTSWFPTAVVLYVALLCTTETYVGANLLPWLLLGAVAMHAAARRPVPTDSLGPS
jgi:O-antigen ligase